MLNNTEEGFATKAIHAGQDPQQWTHGSVVPPLIMSTTFQKDGPAQHRGYNYARRGNPSRTYLQTCLAKLEGGKHCFVFPSGMGTVTGLMTLLKAGEHVVCGTDVYGGTNRFFRECMPNQNIAVTFADACNTRDFMKAVKPNTKMIWIESPTNPLLRLADIREISQQIKKVRPEIYVAVDNTFATCYFQKPLDLGADIVMYSLTKFMNGHSDVIMGAAIMRRDDIAKTIQFTQNAMGIIPSPFDCSLVLRSLKTLEVRMQQHSKNGLAVAKFLETHPLVTKVVHPFLESHPQHELALKQMSGHSGMVAFYHKGDSDKFLKSIKVITLADSLGGCESLAGLPSVSSHAMMTEEERNKLGINDQLIRLSIGLETEQDLIADLDQALKSSM
ncbi:hypothetical protein QAD02_019602 [Eretmocerus hayati]|uniref:Uncharacterized protein n=1 Tax=Eretmocerus hayati TaxID=131215 RepID=A0ACC2PK55_9HYME|nr:hypothetical protein QAD02_019602 [Eretmocerus hayati]